MKPMTCLAAAVFAAVTLAGADLTTLDGVPGPVRERFPGGPRSGLPWPYGTTYTYDGEKVEYVSMYTFNLLRNMGPDDGDLWYSGPDDFTTLDGTTYTNVRIVQVKTTYIQIEHDGEMVRIESHKLPPCTIVMTDGTKYNDAKVMSYDGGSIEISYDRGIKKLMMMDVHPDIWEAIGLPPSCVRKHAIQWENRGASISKPVVTNARSSHRPKAENRKERIKAGFSWWDGSHIGLTKVIKSSMHDPDSYKHIETGYLDKGEYLIVKTTFSGKNAFGGVVRNTVNAKVDLNGKVIAIIE
jgi:hypothetical protein